MTPTECKALEAWNEVRLERGVSPWPFEAVKNDSSFVAICRLIDEHEAYKQAVSDAVQAVIYATPEDHKAARHLSRFIIPKPDPLVGVVEEAIAGTAEQGAVNLRTALAARGLKIVEATDD